MDNVTREKTLNIMKRAYEKGELGFQKGMRVCSYYDPESQSCCIIGQPLMDYGIIEEDPDNTVREFLLSDTDEANPILGLEEAEDENKLPDEFIGLTKGEAIKLQSLHDDCCHRYIKSDDEIKRAEAKFEKYLYSLNIGKA